jgi:hypothetical protein
MLPQWRCWNKAANLLQAEARSSYDQNIANAIAVGQADALGITDGAEVGHVHK